jgi:putative endonuclease
MKQYYIYIMTNHNNSVLYTGVTNNLIRRVYEHKQSIKNKMSLRGTKQSFATRYNINKLVYYEITDDPIVSISREKQIKAGNRKAKIDLINLTNPDWKDLYPSLIA